MQEIHSRSQPEAVLWLAVIWQALVDANKPSGYKNERAKIAMDAERWLMGCKDMQYVCMLAGVDYELLKERARHLDAEPEYLERIRKNGYYRKQPQAMKRNRPTRSRKMGEYMACKGKKKGKGK